jgi:lactoylglutathione lyase
MSRFHLALTVDDLDRSIAFYNRLLGAEPTRVESDYAKWMIDDPRINLSISTRGSNRGVDHVGLQAEDAAEFAGLRERLAEADAPKLDQENTTCCYARSTKTWVHDPDGVAWETFHTHGDATEYGDGTLDAARLAENEACCVPQQAG